MCKVFSTEDGYSYCIDKEGCVIYKTGEHMTGQEIGDNLNISRSAVSSTLKRAIKKIWKELKKKYHDLSSIEIAAIISEIFNVSNDKEYKEIFKLFPEKIRRDIYEEACESRYIKN